MFFYTNINFKLIFIKCKCIEYKLNVQNFITMKKEKVLINLSEIPLNSSLGLLAFGDIAFTAWREAKKKHNESKNEEK